MQRRRAAARRSGVEQRFTLRTWSSGEVLRVRHGQAAPTYCSRQGRWERRGAVMQGLG